MALAGIVAAVVVVHTVSTRLPAAQRADRPNMVLIVADDLGYGELGCYGQKFIHTPHLDRLAAEGLRFTQFYCGNAVCAPSRCSLLTGKHQGHAYIRDNGNPPGRVLDEKRDLFPGQLPIPDSEVTLAEILRSRGYATAGIGKWGLGYEGSTGDPNRQGFDLFYGFLCQYDAHNHFPRFLWRNGQREALPGNNRTLTGQTYAQDKFIEVALEFVRNNKDRPFFLYLPFTIPHLSIQVPEESLAEYRGVLPEEDYRHTAYLRHPYPRAGYAAMISHMDRGIGQLLELLDELSLQRSTLVLFTSDNGPTYERLGGSDSVFFHSAGPLRGFKGSLYEGGIRVPLITRWPNQIPSGAVSDFPCAFWDILPTLAELAGAEPPTDTDGVSLAATLRGHPQQQAPHPELYWEFPSYGGQQAVRLGNWKGVRQNMLRKNNPQPLQIELYDLEHDIGETTDVAVQHPDIIARMADVMRALHTPSKLFPFPPID